MRERLLSMLSRLGPTSASELTSELGISQSTLYRLIASLQSQVSSYGRARARRHFVQRDIPDLRQPIPLYEVRPRGEKLRRVGELRATGTRGVLVLFDGGAPEFFEDIPWFLQSARPSGFLGRLMPQFHPELGLPDDVRLWSGDHVLRFASSVGWDLPGSFIVGDDACNRFLREVDEPSSVVDAEQRAERYPVMALDLLTFGAGGSSAAGEQPKFLTTRRIGKRLTPVLVKFSPPTTDAFGRRVADLLVAEHVALSIAGENGLVAPVSCVLSAEERLFLESERFDRDGIDHRTGQVSLESLDAEFAGTDMKSWSASVETLVTNGKITGDIVPQVRWLETFGSLIGNTDMHFGNLAFQMDCTRITSLAPVYDMLPMHYYPQSGELPLDLHTLPDLGVEIADVAAPALNAAIEFWNRLAEDDRVSEDFQRIAAQNTKRTSGLQDRVNAFPVTTMR